ncbi:VWA domain-containing protein [Massilia dura]|uniref:VWA domain-containing protein n=1 Tax=Pseudoduganella dura TaxID=321982 RepID=A0A6I3XCQ0_9BURK|nr:VWA domain-containing protein [Pseudoduganella dura]MUI12320.1 VWA domain-containing protein [Pseudoduganella dura]GGY20752.1 VWA domain-containing protein [Pseudoduganella dura]
MTNDFDRTEAARRWRLVLGGTAADTPLAPADLAMDRALDALYGAEPGTPRGGLGASAPNVARWLGDIRQYFPSTVVQVMQKDALDRLGLQRMLCEPEMLQAVEPDVHLVATLLSLNRIMPNKTRSTARAVVSKVVRELEAKLASPLRQAVTGSLNRATRNRRPRHNEIDWMRTIRANLKHWQPDYQTIIPETRIGFGRKGQSLRDIVLCIDQSGSMAPSVVYASVFAAVLASIRAVSTSVVVFDTAVVDLTPLLSDPVEVLFGTQLGGGTDINRALAYSQGLVRRPKDTIFVLISDLYEGGRNDEMLRRAAAMIASGVQFIVLLALDDQGAPSYDKSNAAQLVAMGAPCFACTPDLFPDLMAAAIKRTSLEQWAAKAGIVHV